MSEHHLIVHGWHTECGSCGYGRGGPYGGPGAQGKPILTPRSTVCHGCGVTFTHRVNAYALTPPESEGPIPLPRPAA